MPLKHQQEKEHSRAINVQRCLYRTSLFFITLWYSWFQLVHRELRISPYSAYSLEPCILSCAPRVESDLSGITFLTFFFCFFEGLCEDAQKALKHPWHPVNRPGRMDPGWQEIGCMCCKGDCSIK